jgi:hypothetical protein
VRKHESDDSDKADHSWSGRRSKWKYRAVVDRECPLVGNGYKTGAQKVQQLIGFVQEEIAETKIKPKEKKQDGRNDINTLRRRSQ